MARDTHDISTKAAKILEALPSPSELPHALQNTNGKTGRVEDLIVHGAKFGGFFVNNQSLSLSVSKVKRFWQEVVDVTQWQGQFQWS